MSSKNYVEAAIKRANGVNNLARSLRVSPQVVSNWRKRGLSVHGSRLFERVLKIKRCRTRPDIFGR